MHVSPLQTPLCWVRLPYGVYLGLGGIERRPAIYCSTLASPLLSLFSVRKHFQWILHLPLLVLPPSATFCIFLRSNQNLLLVQYFELLSMATEFPTFTSLHSSRSRLFHSILTTCPSTSARFPNDFCCSSLFSSVTKLIQQSPMSQCSSISSPRNLLCA